MKGKDALWIVTAVLGIAAVITGAIIFVNKYLNDRRTCTEYIECDCSEDAE